MLMKNIISCTIKNGGGTFYPDGSLYNSLGGGYAVAISKSYELEIHQTDFTPETLRNYIKKYQKLLNKRGYFLGTWIDTTTNMVYLDISMIIPDLKQALKEAEKNKQLAIYDLKKDVSIYL